MRVCQGLQRLLSDKAEMRQGEKRAKTLKIRLIGVKGRLLDRLTLGPPGTPDAPPCRPCPSSRSPLGFLKLKPACNAAAHAPAKHAEAGVCSVHTLKQFEQAIKHALAGSIYSLCIGHWEEAKSREASRMRVQANCQACGGVLATQPCTS